MVSPVVLITGVSGHLGAVLAARLAADDGVARVIGVDTRPPAPPVARRLGRVEFVRADIRNPLIAKVIGSAGVDTVVHLSISATPSSGGGRAVTKEKNVIGTMQLLAACQKSECVRRLVVKSTTAVYGVGPRDPAVFTEETEQQSSPRSGYAKDSVEIEEYVRGFGRRRPDIALTLLRFANIIGPLTDTPLTRYFLLPIVPTVLGFDPRLQFVHEDDAIDVLARAGRQDYSGTVNVAADGVLALSQAIRRAGRLALPVPEPAAGVVARVLRGAGWIDFPPEQTRFLRYGRVVDTTRLHKELGHTLRFSTEAAFEDFVHSRGLRPVVDPTLIASMERRLGAVLAGRADG